MTLDNDSIHIDDKGYACFDLVFRSFEIFMIVVVVVVGVVVVVY